MLPRHGRLNSFQTASSVWGKRLSKPTRFRNTILSTNPRQPFRPVNPGRIHRFNLWNNQNNDWSTRIQSAPILLTPQNINRWTIFRTQTLEQNRLYLWHATPNEWVPLWSLQNGFLLKNMSFIGYDQISYEQLTRTKWIQINSVSKKQFTKF